MIKIKDKYIPILKWIFVAVITGMIVYTFRDLAGPILKQLRETSGIVVLLICCSSTAYELLEAWVTYRFAKQYHPGFTYRNAVVSAFYISFYRTATLGSGAGISAIYFFNEKGIPVSKGTGMYMIEYVVHKLCIAIFSGIFFILNIAYMREHFGEYSILLAAAYGITFVIALSLTAACCSRKLHQGVVSLLNHFNKSKKLDQKIQELQEQAGIMEEAAGFLLKRKELILATVLKNILKLAFWYGIPYIIFWGDVSITLSQVLAITSLSVMMAAVVPSPAGIGATEFIFTLLFSGIAGTKEAGAASLLYRFATFVFPFVVGGIIVLLRRFRKRRK